MSSSAPSDSLLATFRPLLEAARGVDLSAPDAETELARRFDPAGSEADALSAELLRLYEEGRIANRGEPPVRYGRVAKAGPATHGYSIDVVHMSAAGPRHRHPNGEIDFCIALDGSPRFDGRPPGWVVYPPESTHVPTVEGGTMLICYLLPEGAIDFQ